jgi:hypothetical protein
MSKQYNKVEKRVRRTRYVKRQKEKAKTKTAAPAKAPPAA